MLQVSGKGRRQAQSLPVVGRSCLTVGKLQRSRMSNPIVRNLENLARVLHLAVGGAALSPINREWRARVARARESIDHPFPLLETELSAFLDRDIEPVIVGPVSSAHANVSEYELLVICSFVVQIGARRIFEIGTYDGRTTLAVARNMGSDGHVATLNLPPDWSGPGVPRDDAKLASAVVSGERFLGSPEAARITQLWGDSAQFDFSPFRNKMDLVFIDGAHSEEYAKTDTKTALTLIGSAGGLVLWHDATRYGVAKYLTRAVRAGLPLRIVRGTSVGVCAVDGGTFVDAVAWCRAHRSRREERR
jgi:predicted O-methyltransferase YrrM